MVAVNRDCDLIFSSQHKDSLSKIAQVADYPLSDLLALPITHDPETARFHSGPHRLPKGTLRHLPKSDFDVYEIPSHKSFPVLIYRHGKLVQFGAGLDSGFQGSGSGSGSYSGEFMNQDDYSYLPQSFHRG